MLRLAEAGSGEVPVSVELNFAEPLSEADLLSLLRRVERGTSGSIGGVLSGEVDSLLGRVSAGSSSLDSEPDEEEAPDPFAWFHAMLGSTPEVARPIRVVRAARAVEVGVFASETLDARDDLPDEERSDLQQLVRNGEDEYRFLVESNIRLVHHWARRLQPIVGDDLVQDAFQAGCIGLMRGIQGWDYELGYAFSTYVSWHIRQAIQRWRCDESTLIRLPVHVWERLNSESLDLSENLRVAADRALKVDPLSSIDETSEEFEWDGGLDDLTSAIDRQQLVALLFAHLTDREERILRLRHGLDGSGEPRTLDEIGAVFGLTRERIRQIESKAIKTLREIFLDGADESF